MKRKLSLVLAVLLSLSILGGCSEEEKSSTSTQATEKVIKHIDGSVMDDIARESTTDYIMYNGEKVELVGDTIADDCFFGDYHCDQMDYTSLPEDAEIRKQFDYSLSFDDVNYSELPIEVDFGRGYEYSTPVSHVTDFSNVTSDNWDSEFKMNYLLEDYDQESAEVLYKNYFIGKHTYTAKLKFVPDDKYGSKEIICKYEIDGNKINLQEITPREDNGYDLTGFEISYEYNYNGNDLILSKDGKEINLNPHFDWLAKSGKEQYNRTCGAVTSLDKAVGDIAYLDANVHYDNDIQSYSIVLSDLSKPVNPVIEFMKDATFRISWLEVEYKDENYKKQTKSDHFEITGQYIGRCSDDGFVLIVDNKAYAYTLYRASEEYKNMILAGVQTNADTSNLDDEKAMDMVVKQAAARSQLEEALTNGLNIEYNKQTGEVVMDSELLFGFDKDELEPDGKASLDDFLKAYTPAIKKLKEDGTINGIKVLGYTDSKGSYEYNMTLSEKRAENVVNYINENYPDMKDIFEFEGRSSNNLIYNPDGTVDDDASRRVTFDLIINAE